jgi:two-component system, LytTR family, sensor kinase
VIKLNDRVFRITSILALFLLFFYLKGWHTQPFNGKLILRVLLSLFTIAGMCEGNRWLIVSSHRWPLGKYRILKRMLVIVFAGTVLTATMLLLTKVFNYYISHGVWELNEVEGSHLYVNGKQVTAGPFGTYLFNGFMIFWAFYIVYETRAHFARMKYMEDQKEKLEKEKLKSELHHLKEMVNPHFLFNTLNSLSALISENPRQAEIFLDELTRVYRYLLRNNEVDLITLTNELQFIRSYFHLLKTRYGDGVHFITDIKLKSDDWLMPPLTLQLLVENAVKHNRLMKDQPLTIHLFTTPNNELVVSNNLQKKDTVVDSTKVGLQNIHAKYRLLQKPGIVINNTGNTFSVTIPLIANGTH